MMLFKKPWHADSLSEHGLIRITRAAYAKHRYAMPMFVLRETLAAFRLHNGLSLSASLSFYAMFALIPMAVLIFFMLSHLVVSSGYAIVKLAIITSNLTPNFSQRIMLEVYKVSGHKVAWGAFGSFALLWVITPLASALRSAFYTILSMVEKPSIIRRKVKDVIAVLGILLMFLVFTLLGLIVDKIFALLDPVGLPSQGVNLVSSILIGTLIISMFYGVFFPARVALRHILIGALFTSVLWLATKPLFGLVLSLNQSYGTLFGGMKNMLVSIGWLYYSFAVFLLGTELISTLRKKDVLLLRDLFHEQHDHKDRLASNANSSKIVSSSYLHHLFLRYGQQLQQGDVIFKQGEASQRLYFLLSGSVLLNCAGHTIKSVQAGDYFGEMALLAQTPRSFDAIVESPTAQVIIVSAEHLQTLLMDDPGIAMKFLKHMALQLQANHKALSK